MYFKILVFLPLVNILHCVPIKSGETGNELINTKNTPDLKIANIESHGGRREPAPADGDAAPPSPKIEEMERYLGQFLGLWYDTYVKAPGVREKPRDFHDEMQSDQPNDDDESTFRRISIVPMYQNRSSVSNLTEPPPIARRNYTDIEFVHTLRNKTKNDYVDYLKRNIWQQIGPHSNISIPEYESDRNWTNLMRFIHNDSRAAGRERDPVHAEKIRSFYPICEMPKNTDQDAWKDEHTLNLYFNVDYEKNATVASATLRLHRIPRDNLTEPFGNFEGSCENAHNEDEKLLRITIYWYTKSLRKNRVKRRMCDSKVVAENDKYVELSVKSATKAWNKGRNLGLAVTVEDQDGGPLNASRFFKGASCTVGMSTPRPIPTFLVDAAKRANQLGGAGDSPGHDTVPIVHPAAELLPTIDICTWEFPAEVRDNRLLNCHPQRIRDHQSRADLSPSERFVSDILNAAPNHHIRHMRRLEENADRMESAHQKPDPRSMIVGKQVVIRSEDLVGFNAHINR